MRINQDRERSLKVHPFRDSKAVEPVSRERHGRVIPTTAKAQMTRNIQKQLYTVEPSVWKGRCGRKSQSKKGEKQ